MNLLLKKLSILVLVLLSSFFISYAEQVCCYQGSSVSVENDEVCTSNDGINLGGIQSIAGGGDFCPDDSLNRQSCELSDGTYTNTIGGYSIYDDDNNRVYDMITDETGINPTQYCEDLVEYNSSYGSSEDPGIGTGDPGDSDSGNNDDSSSDNEELSPSDPEYEIGEDDLYQSLSNTCQTLGGGFKGFLNNKNSCENVVYNENNGENPCIYNPFRGGLFSSMLNYDYSNSLKEFEEPACVSKKKIRYCSNYKTKNNCESNIATQGETFSSQSTALKDGCKWVESDEYASTLEDQDSGMCISKSVDEDSNFISEEFKNRKNILKNPSFRDSLDNWNTNGELTDKTSFDDDQRAINLTQGQSITQTIDRLGSQDSYITKFQTKFFDELPSVEIKKIYDDGEVQTVSPQSDITPQPGKNIFQRMVFSSQTISSDVKKINFTIIANSDTIIDMVSLESSSTSSMGISYSNSFIPVEVIPREASSCSLCYDKLGLNTCTQEKSNRLGACSYMVSGPDKKYVSNLGDYSGKNDNNFLDKWGSQSLSNSDVFCEMYTQKNQCVDPDNAVNKKYSSLHLNSDSNLCDWNEKIGCFKDSNDDDIPDVKNGLIDNSNLTQDEQSLREGSNLVDNYNFDSSNSPSDFELACDTVPPMVYNYISAKNSSGGEINIEDDSLDQLIGNTSVVLNVKDYFPFEGPCRDYSSMSSPSTEDVEPQTYVVLELDGKSIKEEVDQYSTNQFNLKEMFSLDSLSENPEINIEVFDQSGNLGLEKNIEVSGMDLLSPSLFLENLDVVDADFNQIDSSSSNDGFRGITNYLALDSQFNFSIEDEGGGINTCTYSFENKPGEETINYEGSNNEELSINISNHYSQDDIPSTGMTSYLNLECEDIFGQKTQTKYQFTITGEFLIDKPKPFKFDPQDYTSDNIKTAIDGIYNEQEKEVLAYSSRRDISSCKIGGNNLNVEEGDFEVEKVEDQSFPIKITGDLNFNDDGVSEETIDIICDTQSGSQLSYSYPYFYEEEPPLLQDYKLYSDSNNNETYYDENKNRWYSVLEPNELNYNLTLDGTDSWISKYYNIYLKKFQEDEEDEKINGDLSKIYNNIKYSGYEEGHNFQSNALLYGIDLNPQQGSSQEATEDDFLRFNFNLELMDKANNTNNQTIEYYYDNNVPEIKFSGDIISQDDDEGVLFTSQKNPTINVSFNTPDYRKYSCDLTLNANGQTFNNNFNNNYFSDFSFRISEILGRDSVDVSNEDIEFSLNCEDETYDINQEVTNNGDTYQFEFDNTAPVLENLSLKESSQRYFGIGDGLNMDEISDDLVFEFNDTGEIGYKCEYRVQSPSNYYSCDSTQESMNFRDSSTTQEVSLDILLGNNGIDKNAIDDNFKCNQRTQDFWDEYSAKTTLDRNLVEPIESEIEIVAKCEDMVGLETEEKSTTLDVVYSKSNIADVEFIYERGLAKPQITLLSSAIPGDLEYVFKKTNGEEVFSSKNANLEEVAGSSAYDITFGENNGISLDDFLGGEYSLTLEVYSNGNLFDSKSNIPLLVDRKVPSSNITILDNIEGEIDSQNFEINVKASDEEPSSGIEDVNLYAKEDSNEEELIYSKEESSEVVDDYQSKSTSSIVVRNKNNEFEANYFFEGNVDSQYEFVLEVVDSAGNVDRSNITTQIVNDATLELENTQTSKVFSNPYELLTRSNGDNEDLEISMRMDPESTCSINPYVENNLEGISDKSQNYPFGLGGELSVEMNSAFDSFSMDKAQDNTIILYIECERDEQTYNFKRKLTKISGVPDYTLESSEGFYFNSYNNNHYSTRFDVESVGPYKQILCNMNFEDQDFELGPGTGFSLDYNFSSEISQTNRDLTLQCEDPFGVEGAEKTYDFVISQDTIEIGEISLLGENLIQKTSQNDDTFYVAENKNYNFEFEVNKRGGSCEYKIDGDNNLFEITTGYIKNLLNIGYNSIDESQTPYVYRGDEMSFSQDSKIDIECGDGRVSKTIDIDVVEDTSYEVDIS